MSCIIGLIQISVSPHKSWNIQHAMENIREAAESGAQIICLPELFSTPYFPQHIGLDSSPFTDTCDGATIYRFSKLALELGCVLIVPICEKSSDNRIYNSAVVIDADGSVFRPYRKIHIPQDPLFYEKGYFNPGDEYRIYKTKYANLAVLICFDQWFPEAAREVALNGADIIFYPTAIGHIKGEIPAEGDWKESWKVIQRSHAIANSIPVAAVNRCGWEDELFFFGSSFICDAFGKILVQGDIDEEIILAEVDLSLGPSIREAWGFFRNRRPDTYHSLTALEKPGSSTESLTPANQGYHMPAEWEHHDAVWMAWPYNDLTFPHLEAVEETYLTILSSLRSERVELLIADPTYQEKILHMLSFRGVDCSHIRFHIVHYSDVWIRDFGPTCVVNRALHDVSAVFWDFNAWGNKYDELILDGVKTHELFQTLGMKIFRPGIVLEGGSIDSNGQGCVLTTRQCLLNPNRNPHLTQDDIEHYLCEYLCARKIIWLDEGIAGDDTDGHIDDIARFVNPTTVVCAIEENQEDENYLPLQENFRILSKETDQNNNPLTVIPIPMPHPVKDESNRYPASYLNFYIGNEVVLVPVFDDEHDSRALEILQPLFPDREVIGIPARAMVEGFGTIHCATQQQPSA
ncbi:MAG: C-N hydrolase family amidase [Euryarchaeota archaeon ADurb.Bin294]|nr:MAG: C-N hydrolase family amidase [Euryarchaeota archaeon ADurb.Bin294]